MPYATRSDIEDYLGEEGVDLLTDDLSSASREIGLALQEADDFLLQYLTEKYDPEQLTGVSWVRRRATEIACYFLFLRRGQEPPRGLAETFVRIRDDLEQIIGNERAVIPGANPREQSGPSLSNYVVDDRRLNRRLAVDSDASNNPYTGRRDYQNPFYF